MPNRAQRAASVRAYIESLRPAVKEIISSGITSRVDIAKELNLRNIAAAEGGKWHPSQVSTLLLRLGFIQ